MTSAKPFVRQALMLGTLVSVTVYDPCGEALAERCIAEIARYEAMLSRFCPESEVSKLNTRAEKVVALGEDLYRLIDRALYFSALSGGAFDITTEPISSVWNIGAKNPEVPGRGVIEKALAAVGYEKLSLRPESRQVEFSCAETRVDLGGIAKGYIADRLKEFLRGAGVKHGIINLGGNVLCLGGRPDGTPFLVGIQKPFAAYAENQVCLRVGDMSVVSSGTYERKFQQGGKVYHHILNPRTGYPFDSDLVSATVISASSMDGDGLSTICLAVGAERGLSLLNSLAGVYGIFIDKHGKVFCSRGAQEYILFSHG